MQETKPNTILQEESQLTWLASIIILWTILASILGLYGYTYIQDNTISRLNTEITQIESEIQIASSNKDIIVANILNSSSIRPSLDLKTLISVFRKSAAIAGVRFKGFSVNTDMITSSLVATRENMSTDSIELIIAMMRNENPTQKLVLMPILSVAGTNDERTTAISFRVLPTNPTTNGTN